MNTKAGNTMSHFRVATLTLWLRHGDWPVRRDFLIDVFRTIKPDVVGYAESIRTEDYDQATDLLGQEFNVLHSTKRTPEGMGKSVASRWPIRQGQEVELALSNCERIVHESRNGTWASDRITAKLGISVHSSHHADRRTRTIWNFLVRESFSECPVESRIRTRTAINTSGTIIDFGLFADLAVPDLPG